ncbi:DUF2860 domain-containing protein [Enterovibrio baiacu]|uniref:DUF2860 domain-containing protein n=1 Tax=Enterovibrio baiacu TaxID=2491023 RepID=UPI0010118062|nr:DUF2860 domain-containing protein [Enterovibrio baiacu]MBE1275841.1 DUF2860 domain-containing protein [Enterovibrio baiacu]
MKMNKYTLIGLAITPFFAQAQLAEQGGLSGEISVLGGVVSTDSNLSTSGENTKNGELNSNGDREADAIFGALGKLAFTFGSGLDKQIFVGTSREDIAIGTIALEAGYKQQFGSGTTITASYLPTLVNEDIWADPYITRSPRTETEKSGNAYRFQVSSIGGSPLSVDLAFAETDIENEQSGQALGLSQSAQESLQRSGDTFYSKLSYRQFLGRGLGVTPSLIYFNHDADGQAMSYQAYGGELTYFSFAGRNKIVLTGSYQYSEYDSAHPVFGQPREDSKYGVFLAYEYAHLFEIHPLSLVVLAGYNNTESNIDFYDARQYLASAGVSFRF